MLGPRLTKLSSLGLESLAKRSRNIATASIAAATILVVGYSVLWWFCVFVLVDIGRSYGAAASFILLGLVCVIILTPAFTAIGLADLIENFLPLNKEDIQTRELVGLLAAPMLLSLSPFLWGWVMGVRKIGEFNLLAGVVFLLCLAIGYSSQTQQTKAKGKS